MLKLRFVDGWNDFSNLVMCVAAGGDVGRKRVMGDLKGKQPWMWVDPVIYEKTN